MISACSSRLSMLDLAHDLMHGQSGPPGSQPLSVGWHCGRRGSSVCAAVFSPRGTACSSDLGGRRVRQGRPPNLSSDPIECIPTVAPSYRRQVLLVAAALLADVGTLRSISQASRRRVASRLRAVYDGGHSIAPDWRNNPMPKRLIIPWRSETHLSAIADNAMQQPRPRREARPEDVEKDHENQITCRCCRPWA
jgi:hypothetical protein